jgi:glycosyltransferase involved in cell wall biosynthesis
MPRRIIAIVTARDEGDRLPATLAALRGALPGAQIVVADDGSRDATPQAALKAGAELVRTVPARGKGGAATAAAERVLADALHPDRPIVVLCDGDLGESAARLGALATVIERGEADLVVAAFARTEGGGLGLAMGFARRAVRGLCGLDLHAPISGQRALRGDLLPFVVPFAHGFGMEIGMTVDAARAGYRVAEVPLELAHRATGRDVRGFLHRGRQLADFARVWLDRRLAGAWHARRPGLPAPPPGRLPVDPPLYRRHRPGRRPGGPRRRDRRRGPRRRHRP